MLYQCRRLFFADAVNLGQLRMNRAFGVLVLMIGDRKTVNLLLNGRNKRKHPSALMDRDFLAA